MTTHSPYGDVVFGTRLGSGKEVVLSGKDAGAHLFVLAKTGMGKSKLLAALIVQWINQGIGCLVIDPHSDLCTDVLRLLLETGFYTNPLAYRRVLYVPFAGSRERYVPFDVLRQRHLSPHETARLVWSAMTRAWSGLEGTAPSMEQTVLAGALALLQSSRPLTDLHALFTNPALRAEVVGHVTDPQVRDYFTWYEAAGRRGGQLAESALRRLFLLSFTLALRYSLGQDANALDLRALMDGGVTVLGDLGNLDEATQRLFGCLLTCLAQEAALSRAELPEAARRHYRLILDEWSMFAEQSEVALDRMLALVRKFGLSVVLSAQTLGQTRKLQSALQNCIPVLLGLGGLDAEWGAARVGSFEPTLIKTTAGGTPVYISRAEQMATWADRLEQLPPRHAVMRLGGETIPFYTLGIRASQGDQQKVEAIKERYAQLLLVPKEEIEARWHRLVGDRRPIAPIAPDPPRRHSQVEPPVRRIIPWPGQQPGERGEPAH